MEMSTKTFDGGFTENIGLDVEYERDFIAEKGLEQWMAYRREWDERCRLKDDPRYPLHLEFELNYSCNLKCPMCTWAVEDAAQRKADWFKFEDYARIIDSAVASGTKSIRLCYINEPLIRQDIDQFVKYAVDAGILDALITTNGTLLTGQMSKKLIAAGLTKLNVSLDATTKETYDKIRTGGDFNKTLANIHTFLEVRKELSRALPKLRVTFVETTLNHHEYDDFVAYWKDKADTLGVQHFQNPFGEGKFEDKTRGASLVLHRSRPVAAAEFHCPEPFKRLTLRSNGDVLPCCSFYAVDLGVGNWKQEPLLEIWNSDKMRELRQIHKDGDYFKNGTCKACVENSHVPDI